MILRESKITRYNIVLDYSSTSTDWYTFDDCWLLKKKAKRSVGQIP